MFIYIYRLGLSEICWSIRNGSTAHALVGPERTVQGFKMSLNSLDGLDSIYCVIVILIYTHVYIYDIIYVYDTHITYLY
jgi:hypothetical protein